MMKSKLEKTNENKEIVCIVGLGYVGFPLAVELSKQTLRKVFITEVCNNRSRTQ